MIKKIIILALILCFPVYVFAETIVLKSGKTIEGEIAERTDKYIKVDLYGVPITYFNDDIESIDGELVALPVAKKELLKEQPVLQGIDDDKLDVPRITKNVSGEESIQDILSKAKHFGPAKYTMIETHTTLDKSGEAKPPVSTRRKVWYKAPFMKSEYSEPGMKSETIRHPDASYLRLSGERYPKGEYERLPIFDAIKTFEELAKELIENSTLQILGSEVIDGKITTIIDIYPFERKSPGIKQKFWIWNEKGIPLKIQTIGENEGYAIQFEHKDFIFKDFPDSIFDVPKDKVKDLVPEGFMEQFNESKTRIK